MSISEFELRLLKKGVSKGISPDFLHKAIRSRRIATRPLDWLDRRRRARAMPGATKLIDANLGYARLKDGQLPHLGEAVAAAQDIITSAQIDAARAKKPFFSNVMTHEHLERYPEILHFARSDELVEAVAGYFGEWPVLVTLGVFVSQPTDGLAKSQLFHVDSLDKTIMKCFVNVTDVKPENGPFTFVPADRSDAIRAKLGHRWRGDRLTDEDVTAHLLPGDTVSLTGAPGTAAFVDTARCLHFGSRCEEGMRAVIMVNYARRDHFMPRRAGENREGMALLFSD